MIINVKCLNKTKSGLQCYQGCTTYLKRSQYLKTSVAERLECWTQAWSLHVRKQREGKIDCTTSDGRWEINFFNVTLHWKLIIVEDQDNAWKAGINPFSLMGVFIFKECFNMVYSPLPCNLKWGRTTQPPQNITTSSIHMCRPGLVSFRVKNPLLVKLMAVALS